MAPNPSAKQQESNSGQNSSSNQSAGGSVSSRPEAEISPELTAKHDESVKRYPRLHLTPGEYVLMEVRRHPIGLISIWAVVGLVVVGILALLPYYGMNHDSLALAFVVNPQQLPAASELVLPLLALAVLFALGGLIATYIYNNNLFYITNESIMQYTQSSLLSNDEQQINLVNIDDASYRQRGLLQQVFNYGTLRVSTEGNENSYRFYYVASPQRVVRTINDAMEEATGFAVRYRSHHRSGDIDRNRPDPSQF